MTDVITIKSISSSPYDIWEVLKRLPEIRIPCTITSFGDFDNFTLFNIDFLTNAITVSR